MPTNEKILQSIMSGTQDRNIYTFNENPEIINIQPNKNMAKPYQIKQIRNYIIKYRLGL